MNLYLNELFLQKKLGGTDKFLKNYNFFHWLHIYFIKNRLFKQMNLETVKIFIKKVLNGNVM